MGGWMGGWMDGSKSQFKDCLQQSIIILQPTSETNIRILNSPLKKNER